MNEPSPYSFFLKTENNEPLITLVDKLNRKILENQQIISRITATVDTQFAFPDQINTGKIHESTPSQDNLITSKYKLNDIPLKNDYSQYTNPRVRKLLEDNEKLSYLQRVNSYKNNELLKVYQDYEIFIIDQILPSLRKDIYSYHRQQLQQLVHKDVQVKDELTAQIWDKYNGYVKSLAALKQISDKILKLMEQDLTNDELRSFNSKMATINSLVNFLS